MSVEQNPRIYCALRDDWGRLAIRINGVCGLHMDEMEGEQVEREGCHGVRLVHQPPQRPYRGLHRLVKEICKVSAACARRPHSIQIPQSSLLSTKPGDTDLSMTQGRVGSAKRVALAQWFKR